MDWKPRILSAVSSAGHELDEDVVEELAGHAQAMYDRARADGNSPAEAERQVDAQVAAWRDDAALLSRRRGSAAVVPPPADGSRGWGTGLARDVRYAARLLRRQAAFAVLVIVTMALGIGATTTLFSLVYGVLAKPLPWPDGNRLVVLNETRGGHPPRFNSFTNSAYLAWRERATTVEDLAAWSRSLATLDDGGEPERIRITRATASLFTVLRVRPVIGRLIREEDEAAADGGVVVLSESLWRRRFGGDPNVLGRLVRLDGKPHGVIGVVPDALAFPDRQTLAFVPSRVPLPTGNLMSVFNAVARLRAGATTAQAAAEGTARGRFAADTGMTTMAIFGSNGPIEVSVSPLRETLVADVSRPLIVLLIAVALLLAAGTANVANLQLARATSRRREMAIRAALGAGTATVVRQMLIESLLLGLLGGAAGLALAWLLHGAMVAILPTDFPRAADLGVDRVVVGFAFLLSLVTSVAFGLLPALHTRRFDLVNSLADNGTRAAGGASTGGGTARARLAIMIAQVAIASVLLVGGSLLGRSFVALLNADRGYDPHGIVTARLALPGDVYRPERRFAVVNSILDRLAAVPGVRDASFTSEMPLTPGGSTSAFTLRSPRAEAGTVSVQASPRLVSAHYFRALRMRMVAGRGFTDADTETSRPVAIVNRAFARRYLGDAAVGAEVPMGVGYLDNDSVAVATVVGVLDDVRYLTAGDATLPEIYYCFRQLAGKLPVPVVTLLVRAEGETARVLSSLRAVVRGADPGLVPEAVGTLQDRVLTALARPRLYAVLLGGFAALALLVAAVGLFGILSYSVALRSRELAVRMALGARPADIVRLVVVQALAVTGAGIAAGFLASAWLSRAMASLLYGVTEHDPATYVAVVVLLVIATVVSCAVPARRAARLDPLHILRSS